jgi:hypothetical protein
MQKLGPEAVTGAAAWLNLNHNLPNTTTELKRETPVLKGSFSPVVSERVIICY